MPTQIALIRGINVGKAHRVAMADLRSLMEGLGFENVRTLLNSGNVVFSARSHRSIGPNIEKALAESLGVTAKVILLTAEELASIVAQNPLLQHMKDPSRLILALAASADDCKRLHPLLEQDWSPDRLAIQGRAAYLWCENGVLESKLQTAASRLLKDATTARNWSTILKLHALAREVP